MNKFKKTGNLKMRLRENQFWLDGVSSRIVSAPFLSTFLIFFVNFTTGSRDSPECSRIFRSNFSFDDRKKNFYKKIFFSRCVFIPICLALLS